MLADRRILQLSFALLLGLLACQGPTGDTTAQTGVKTTEDLVVASFGGAWQQAQRMAMFEPFYEETGIGITEREYDGAFDLLKENCSSGEWDVVDVEPAELYHGAEEGLYEPIDYSEIDRSALLDSALHPYGVGIMTYAIVLGYNSETFSDPGSAPSTWADFWDLERFPGKRALRNNPQWMLEIALLADGVPPDELYPLDLDRAMASLAKIQSSVVIFDAWSQPADLLTRGDVALSVGTNGRLLAARDEGKPIAISWKGGLVALDYWVIAAGSEHKEAAQRFVRFSVSESAQSAFPPLISYGPVNELSQEDLAPEVARDLPTAPENLADEVFFDAEWWNEHEIEANRRYNEWLAAVASSSPSDG
jgi:putative spermidine/putrescine transport system substrate-binding protein